MKKSKDFLVYLIYFILVITWGSSFILMKRGLEYYKPEQVATIRMLSASLFFFSFGVFHIFKIPAKKVVYVMLSGLFGIFIPAYLFCYAEAGLNSAITGILNALTPSFTLILGILFFRQVFIRMQVIGLLVGFIGIAFLVLVDTKGELELNHFALFVIAATICYGLSTNIVKNKLADINPLYISSVSVSFAGLLALFYFMFTGGFHLLPLTQQNKVPLIATITLGLFGTAMAQLLFNDMIKKSSAVFASSITYVLPIVAVFWGVLDGEKLVLWHYFGMACIIAGVIIIRRAHITARARR